MQTYVRMIIGECVDDDAQKQFIAAYGGHKVALKKEPGFLSGRAIVEEAGNLVVCLAVWSTRESCLRYHSSRVFRQFVVATQPMLRGNWVVKLFSEETEEVEVCG